MKRVKATITAKHARALHADIRIRDRRIQDVTRELLLARDEVSDLKARALQMEHDRDALALTLEKSGTDLRAANDRAGAAREVASQLLDGVNTVCTAAQSVSVPSYLTRTLLTLQRDGRAQLVKLQAANGQAEATR